MFKAAQGVARNAIHQCFSMTGIARDQAIGITSSTGHSLLRAAGLTRNFSVIALVAANRIETSSTAGSANIVASAIAGAAFNFVPLRISKMSITTAGIAIDVSFVANRAVNIHLAGVIAVRAVKEPIAVTARTVDPLRRVTGSAFFLAGFIA